MEKFSNVYVSDCHRKYYLKVHLIFVCKYRKKLLNDIVSGHLKSKVLEISQKYDFLIDVMETDKDHLHMLVGYKPNISVSSIVRALKQETTISLWKCFNVFLSKYFWKEHTFWSDGYFACSIGEASPETIRRYIENQG